MPIYEYLCNDCGHQEEILQKFSDSALTHCPKCGKNNFNKVISATQFQLKGSGWYVTDFKNSGSQKKEGAAPKTEGGSDQNTKTKPSTDSE